MPFSSFYHVNEIQSFEMATTVWYCFPRGTSYRDFGSVVILINSASRVGCPSMLVANNVSTRAVFHRYYRFVLSRTTEFDWWVSSGKRGEREEEKLRG